MRKLTVQLSVMENAKQVVIWAYRARGDYGKKYRRAQKEH